MSFYADLHIHSKYSRATSRDCDLENLTYWGRKKGITVIGTGDFTHPAWFKEIKEKLVPAEPGLFRLKPDLEKKITEKLPPACQGATRFMLSVEISTIYKKGDKVRKIHHLVYSPSFEKVEKINRALEKIGNIRSDGRPILGLDSRHLLEIVLQAGDDCYIVPAHIWTPWFAVLGSKSGFDSVADCYADLADHIFAVETGLSSDPEMNWRVKSLDRYRLMSNSDAHSPQKLGREVNRFETPMDYYAMKKALETGKGYGGTLEFFPEEGKYHMDGHRNCGVRLHPEESRAHKGLCPECKKPLTLGVLYRVEELAGRPAGQKPENASDFSSIIPLPEVISEIADAGPATKGVQADYEKILSKLGDELGILNRVPVEEIQKNSSSALGEAIARMRAGNVIREAGYDGEYGRIKLFKEGELKTRGSAGVLFDVEAGMPKKKSASLPKPAVSKIKKLSEPSPAVRPAAKPASGGPLDPDQGKALEIVYGSLLIIAGPGSGKTRTLTHRVAHLIKQGHAKPEECLTLTFTRRAASEMQERLEKLLPGQSKKIPVLTFHSLGLKILKENRENAGLVRGFRMAGEEERRALLVSRLGLTDAKAKKILQKISLAKRTQAPADEETGKAQQILNEQREHEGWLDYDDLILLSLKVLEETPGLKTFYHERFRFVSIDEYQDIDPLQYRLIRALVPEGGNLCAIGDPDQSIYSFRGADVEFFLRFEADFPGSKKITLCRNYRSGRSILEASGQMLAPAALVEERAFEALLEDTGRVTIHAAPTAKAEAEFVVHTIEQMIGGTSFFSLDSSRSDGSIERNHSFADFAVLCRTEAQAGALEEALLRSGIPFQRNGHAPLNENPLVQAYLAALKEKPENATLLEALKAAKARVEPADAETPGASSPVYEKLKELVFRSADTWETFLSEVHLSQDADLWDERADRVSLLTLHAAKGLEFSVVFIAGCEDGLLPLSFGGEISEAAFREERRLFYVGMTRAKERLFLSHAKKRMKQGKILEQVPSPFLADIEEKLLERSKSAFKKRPQTAQFDLF